MAGSGGFTLHSLRFPYSLSLSPKQTTTHISNTIPPFPRYCKVVNVTMTSKDASSRHGNDTVRTTPVRNPLNIERLSSWIVNHPSPALQSLIFGAQEKSNQDEQWLQERMEVKQFGKSLKLCVVYIHAFLESETDETHSSLLACLDVCRLWAIKSNLLAYYNQLASSE